MCSVVLLDFALQPQFLHACDGVIFNNIADNNKIKYLVFIIILYKNYNTKLYKNIYLVQEFGISLIFNRLSVIKKRLQLKNCLVCNKPFNWRKKWKRDWDNVKYCSEKCRRNKKSSEKKNKYSLD